jgi:S-adenosylmethionine hydrolase
MAKRLNRSSAIVTLTSDFGLADTYVAEMKAAILRKAPSAALIDVTHQIAPGDVPGGSICLEKAIAGFPSGTIHLAVVDPGVGGKRKILKVDIACQVVICPDNGLITWAWRRLGPGKAREVVWRPKSPSPTFHGRDWMGPVVGLLAAGRLREVSTSPISRIVLLDLSPVLVGAKSGRIIRVDHFGNAMTNIPRESLANPNCSVIVKRVNLGKIRRTYVDAAPGEPLALIGSSGLLEIAVRDGSAAKKLHLRVGDEIRLV